MILIGQYDSPFVRRVAVAMRLYGFAYEHPPWSTFGDAERIAVYNPLRRVPTLVLDDGEALIDSTAILDHLDETAGCERAMIADAGVARRQALRIGAMATGMADKAVSLVYERVLHAEVSPTWVARCQAQIRDVLRVLESDRSNRGTPFWFGDAIGHADIAVACAVRFLSEAHKGSFDDAEWPRLAAHARQCEALEAFQGVVQRFDPPK